MSHLSRTKTQGGDRIYKNRLVLAQGGILEAGWSETPAQKLFVWTWTSHENFIKILSFYQKLFYFFSGSYRHRDARPPLHIQMGWNFLMPLLIPFTSPHSPLSLHSWRDNIIFTWSNVAERLCRRCKLCRRQRRRRYPAVDVLKLFYFVADAPAK